MSLPPPGLDDIKAARAVLAGQAVVTPLHENTELNARSGGRVLLKCENLQRTGSFKFRGAYNAIASLDPAVRAKGVVASSSGNHAQGVACAAALFGVPATIVMPEDAPANKVARTRADGADIVFYDRLGEDRFAVAARVLAERGGSFVSPFDDPRVVAGQGTCGLEILDQARALGAVPDAVLVCCSGGGLMSGIALAVKSALPAADIYAVEPADYDDFGRSLRAGERIALTERPPSICDALLVPEPGELTFAIARDNVTGGLSVTEDEVRAAVAFAFEHLKLVVEPGGAVALAAILSGTLDVAGKTVVATLSGGNVDPGLFADIVQSGA